MTTLNHPQTQEVKPPSRREFLYYAGGATVALFASGVCAAIYNLAQVPEEIPRDGPAMFPLNLNLLNTQTLPIRVRDANAWLLPAEAGLVAFSALCPHLSCRLIWFEVNNRYECPCHGDKFRLDGTWIEGIAGRHMDRLTIWVQTPHGILRTPPDGSPVPIHDATEIWIDRSRVIRGKSRL